MMLQLMTAAGCQHTNIKTCTAQVRTDGSANVVHILDSKHQATSKSEADSGIAVSIYMLLGSRQAKVYTCVYSGMFYAV